MPATNTMYVLAGIAGRVIPSDRPRKLWTMVERARFLRALAPGVTTLWMRIRAGEKIKAESFTGKERTTHSEWRVGNELQDYDL